MPATLSSRRNGECAPRAGWWSDRALLGRNKLQSGGSGATGCSKLAFGLKFNL